MTPSRSSEALEVLAVGAHPDDVELFAGGLVARLVELGYRVGIVDLTRGERATRGTPEQRAKEAEAAAEALGVAHRECLDLPDGDLDPSAHDERQVAAVVEVLRRLRPELLVAPWERERHPDHAAACALVTRGVFLAGLARWTPSSDSGHEPHTVAQVLHYPMRELAEPSFVVDVTEAYAKKQAAIACHASQVGPALGERETLVGSPLSLSSLEARDRFYGAHIGVAHGEPYVTRNLLGLRDPVAHFRENGRGRPLFFPARSGGR